MKCSTADFRAEADARMREQIKELVLELLIKHGYRGVSFGDLAAALKTTRANIHYHFGNKESMVEEVLGEYVRVTSEQLNQIWTERDAAFLKKIGATVRYSRRRYLKYNQRKAQSPTALGRSRKTPATSSG